MSLELAGILGDQAHTYGYHRARAVLPADDYSVTLPADRLGNDWAASALDIKPAHPGGMVALTARLQHAVDRRDPRVIKVVREFYGTLNGRQVHGFDVDSLTAQVSDDSHLWHLHISFHREFSMSRKRLLPVADVLAERIPPE